MSIFPPHGPLPPGSTPVPASTVVIFRNCPQGGPPELLMVQRAKDMRFAGGMAVFPGGRIDPEDYDLAGKLAPDEDREIAAAKIGGIRETLEETGLAIALQNSVDADEAAKARAMLLDVTALEPVLDKFGWTLDLSQLSFFAHWCPDFEKAFDTRFFLTDLGTGAVDIEVDATENTRLFWASARKSLELADKGDIKVIYPTRRNLERLALFDNIAAARAQAEEFPVQRITPQSEVREGERWLMIPDGLGYPVIEQAMGPVK